MQLVSFDPLRTWDIPGTRPVKAAQWQEDLDEIRVADWVLFPEYWDDLPFPFVAKEIHNSMGRGVYLIENVADLERYVVANHIWSSLSAGV